MGGLGLQCVNEETFARAEFHAVNLCYWCLELKERSLHEETVRIDASRQVLHVRDGAGEPL